MRKVCSGDGGGVVMIIAAGANSSSPRAAQILQNTTRLEIFRGSKVRVGRHVQMAT